MHCLIYLSFIAVRTFLYSLGKFQVYNILNNSYQDVRWLSWTYFFFDICNPLINISPFVPFPGPDHPNIVSASMRSTLLPSTCRWDHAVSVSGLFHLASRFIHVITNGRIPTFFLAEYYSIEYTKHISLIRSPICGHLSWFHISAIVSNAAGNAGVQMSLTDWVHFFGMWI